VMGLAPLLRRCYLRTEPGAHPFISPRNIAASGSPSPTPTLTCRFAWIALSQCFLWNVAPPARHNRFAQHLFWNAKGANGAIKRRSKLRTALVGGQHRRLAVFVDDVRSRLFHSPCMPSLIAERIAQLASDTRPPPSIKT
jgi:hypothetical protein